VVTDPNWRMMPLVINIFAGTIAVSVGPITAFPALIYAAGALCYVMAIVLAVDWIRRVKTLERRKAKWKKN